MDDPRVYAEDVNYWKSGSSSPDAWIEKTKKLIVSIGGTVTHEAFAADNGGRQAYMLAFVIDGERYKVVWPVLQTKKGDNKIAARRQAATALYHEVKAKVVTVKFLGARAALFSFLELPDGRTATQLSAPELMQAVPLLLT